MVVERLRFQSRSSDRIESILSFYTQQFTAYPFTGMVFMTQACVMTLTQGHIYEAKVTLNISQR